MIPCEQHFLWVNLSTIASLLLRLRFKFGRVGTLGVECEFGFEFEILNLSFRIGRMGTLGEGWEPWGEGQGWGPVLVIIIHCM